MPAIKFQHVCSFSSEERSQPAENLLSLEGFKKWSCATPGEKKAVVILQLERSSQIHGLDIGNNGSAFVEVLVGRSALPDQFEVLLGMSTFMNPSESKNWTNVTRVRMFGKDSFSQKTAGQRWDRVKIVCTQPYNKNEKYGISFIKLHSPPNSNEVTPTDTPTLSDPSKPAVSTKLGIFTLKPETKNLPSGSLFFKKNPTSTSTSKMIPAAHDGVTTAKTAVLPAEALSFDNRSLVGQSEARSLQRKSLEGVATGNRSQMEQKKSLEGVATGNKTQMEQKKSSKGVATGNRSQMEQKKSLEGVACGNRSQMEQKKSLEGVASGDRKRPAATKLQDTSAAKRTKGVRSPPKEEKIKSLPLSKIMEGVVFVLSGFKNPFRGTLRDKGLEMGAIYQADWNDTCTHLICAFPNTPKFIQVKGKRGLIVKKDWIEDSYFRNERLPARKYRLSSGAGDTSSSEGEDERYDHMEANIFKTSDTQEVNKRLSDKNLRSDGALVSVVEKEEEEKDPYEASTDEEMDRSEVIQSKSQIIEQPSSDSDTEDEIERIQQGEGTGRGHERVQSHIATEDDVYGGSTDEDTASKSLTSSAAPVPSKSLLDLPEFFSDLIFFLYGEFSLEDRKLLTRYITAYGGQLANYMSDAVTHVMTQEVWDHNFDEALADNSTLTFVRPRWIFVCHQKQQYVPCGHYSVIPR